MDCEDCCAVTTKALSNQPLQQFVRHQDRGGLLYPSDKLLYVLETLRKFVETSLQKERMLQKPLKTVLEAAVLAVSNSALLKCTASDSKHHKDLAVLVSGATSVFSGGAAQLCRWPSPIVVPTA
ncbi:hypothetical protein HPB50_028006 [Hyalomma asiaticum]|nr:hypothetical protein HPB50_028006 [Hyalomma asiaticum]